MDIRIPKDRVKILKISTTTRSQPRVFPAVENRVDRAVPFCLGPAKDVDRETETAPEGEEAVVELEEGVADLEMSEVE
jgi:hypothetical protein